MFRKNTCHLQPILISNVNDLPEKHRKHLKNSWAGVFYRETFSRLGERRFKVLYADCPSRSNVPVNVMVGLESLKADFGYKYPAQQSGAKILVGGQPYYIEAIKKQGVGAENISVAWMGPGTVSYTHLTLPTIY